jgi:GH15 family glucan-1,4-alpha-glucosidase
MAGRIEDYALIGDCETAALVGRDGSIDWLCVPRFDSPACFASLLGTTENGRWLLAPAEPVRQVRRRYRPDTLILETEMETASGAVRLIDFMPPRCEGTDLVRIVEGVRGQVPMRMDLTIRFDYGSVIPWVRRTDEGIRAVAGPDLLAVRTPVELRGEGFHTVAEFDVAEGERVPFDLTWSPSYRPGSGAVDPHQSLEDTERWWREWIGRATVEGPWTDDVKRSLITLKALTYAPTGGMVAAATTSLPEHLGGVRNWDYRFCWLRDATFTLHALMLAGYREEAEAWREWLLRAVAGTPSQFHIMYGLRGERRLTEMTLDWLPGYEGSKPVRIGNGAWNQHQLDVYGEVMGSLHQARRYGMTTNGEAWHVQQALMEFLESDWHKPDEGIWEVRGPRRHFVHSKVMAWVAFDCAVEAIESYGLEGPTDRWRAIRDTIHAEVCREGFNTEKGAFVQSYGSKCLDASVLMIPLVRFLPATDPRMLGTIAAIERELVTDEGFVRRYDSSSGVDGLPESESAFLLCSFLLADCLALAGRLPEARRVFERVLAIRNDVGLLSEGYDPKAKRLVGNFPQAFSHIGLINTAFILQSQAMP